MYASLDVPDTDIRSAWNLVNPSASSTISKDATLAFLHILNHRHEGYHIPRTVPASLRASFERNQIEYDLGRVRPSSSSSSSSPSAAQRWGARGDEDTSTGRKARFGDTYLSRLGVGGGADAATRISSRASTNHHTTVTTTEDWEEVRLRRQLAELESKLERVDQQTSSFRSGRRGGVQSSSSSSSKSALIKRELEQLLDHKRRQLRDLERGEGRARIGAQLKTVDAEINSIREQVDNLDGHLHRRREVLVDLQREIDDLRRMKNKILF